MGCSDNTLDLAIKQGKSFAQTLQWEGSKLIYKPITAATVADPCVLTVPGHGMPNAWHFTIVSAKSMTKLNVDADTGLGANGEPEYTATVNDANTVELNDVQAGGFKAYLGGGSIVYREPKDLTGYTARMQIKADAADTDVVLELTTANSGVVIDVSGCTITMLAAAAQTALLAPGSYVYDLELIGPGGTPVEELVTGTVTVLEEITT